MAEVAVGEVQFNDFHILQLNAEVGLIELMQLVASEQIDLEPYTVIICLLGSADLHRGRIFARVLEQFIQFVKQLVPETGLIFGGPMPRWQDTDNQRARVQRCRLYAEDRISAEDNMAFCRSGERLTEAGLPNLRLWNASGLTDLGLQVLNQDLSDVLRLLAKRAK